MPPSSSHFALSIDTRYSSCTRRVTYCQRRRRLARLPASTVIDHCKRPTTTTTKWSLLHDSPDLRSTVSPPKSNSTGTAAHGHVTHGRQHAITAQWHDSSTQPTRGVGPTSPARAMPMMTRRQQRPDSATHVDILPHSPLPQRHGRDRQTWEIHNWEMSLPRRHSAPLITPPTPRKHCSQAPTKAKPRTSRARARWREPCSGEG